MLGKLFKLISSGDASPTPQEPLLARVVDLLGPDIARAANFGSSLKPAMQSALDFFDQQARIIPGPLPISGNSFSAQPEMRTIFREPAEVSRALGCSLAVKDNLKPLTENGHTELHALLGMRVKPGSAAGAGPETIYADHVVHSLAPSLEASRENLCLAALDRILKNFAEHVEKLRRRQRLSKLEWEWNLQHDVARTVDAANPEFVYADKELTPDKMLHGLLSWLASPASFFHVKGSHGESGTLPLLHCSDRRQWLICMVRFSVVEAEQALRHETHNHRYIYI